MKVLILSCSTGGGHNAAARALEEELERRHIPCIVKEAIEFASPRTADWVNRFYIETAVHAPKAFGLGYGAAAIVSSAKAKSVVYLANSVYAGQLNDFIRNGGYDVVLTTHLFPSDALTWLKRHDMLSARAYGVFTDYTCSPFWEECELDGYFVSHPTLVEECLAHGMRAEKLIPIGIPVGKRYFAPPTKADARIALDIPADCKMITIMGGGMGFGNPAGLLQHLLPGMGTADRVYCITGSNKKLFAHMTELYGGDGRVGILGYTKNVQDYMAASDVLMTKPGGLTSSEAASLRVPLVHTRAIPGCETKNVEFFTAWGMSCTGRDEKEMAEQALHLLAHPELGERMRRAQAEHIDREAAVHIIDWVEAAQ